MQAVIKPFYVEKAKENEMKNKIEISGEIPGAIRIGYKVIITSDSIRIKDQRYIAKYGPPFCKTQLSY